MSWFLTVMHLTQIGKQWKLGEVWPENGLMPLGTRAEIHALIAEIFPDADFSDPLWIPVRFGPTGEPFGMEIILDYDEPVRWFSLRHGVDEAARLIHERTGWDVLDIDQKVMIFNT
jgi:hypothetical protein